MYPRGDYPKTARAKKFTLQFLIALNQPDKVVLPYIKGSKRFPARLIRKDPNNYNLTPLIIATMKCRLAVVKGLLEHWKNLKSKKKLVNMKDAFGWTALHHAQLASTKIFELLLQNGADLNAKTEMSGSCADLERLTERNITSFSRKKVRFITEKGKAVAISDEILGFTYRDIPLFLESTWKSLWQQTPEVGDCQVQGIVRGILDEFKRNPPKLNIQESNALKGRTDRALAVNAGESLKFGRAIGIYSGRFITKKEANTFQPKSFVDYFNNELFSRKYLFKPFDAEETGGISRLVNWGFPNSFIFSVPALGFDCPCLLSSGIEKGKEILLDYGICEAGLSFDSKMVILGKDEMRAFFRDGLQVVIKKCTEYEYAFMCGMRTQSLTTKKFLLYIDSHKMLFPLNVPGALLDLHFLGLVTVWEWISLTAPSNKKYMCMINSWEKEKILFPIIRSMMRRINEFEVFMLSKKALRNLVAQWVIDQIGKLTVMQILKALDWIAKKSDLTIETWDFFKDEQLLEFLEKYDWKKDPKAPLGFEQTCNDLIKDYKKCTKETSLKILDFVLEKNRSDRGYDGTEEFIQKYEKVREVLTKLPNSEFG